VQNSSDQVQHSNTDPTCMPTAPASVPVLATGVCAPPAACRHACNSGPAEQHHTRTRWRLCGPAGGCVQLSTRGAAGCARDAVAAGWRHVSTGAGVHAALSGAAERESGLCCPAWFSCPRQLYNCYAPLLSPHTHCASAAQSFVLVACSGARHNVVC
jgi:hypothetical protein